jgi:hypothetical protein
MNTNTRENFQRLIAAVTALPTIPTAVAHLRCRTLLLDHCLYHDEVVFR